jgi:hypothetical protein
MRKNLSATYAPRQDDFQLFGGQTVGIGGGELLDQPRLVEQGVAHFGPRFERQPREPVGVADAGHDPPPLVDEAHQRAVQLEEQFCFPRRKQHDVPLSRQISIRPDCSGATWA